MCSSNTPRRQHRQCRATAPTPRPRRLMGLPPATLPIRSAPAPSRDLPAGNGLGLHPLPPGTCRRETVTAYSPLGSTSLSPLVSYSTNSYSPARAPVRPRPRATRSQGEPRRRPSTHQFRRSWPTRVCRHQAQDSGSIDTPRLHPGLAMHVVCSAELADGQRGMGSEGKRLIRVYQ